MTATTDPGAGPAAGDVAGAAGRPADTASGGGQDATPTGSGPQSGSELQVGSEPPAGPGLEPASGRAGGRRHRITPGRIVGALAVSALAGVAVAMLALPAMSLVGLTAKSSADDFLNLPTDLTVPPLPQASRIVDDQGKTIASLSGNEDRTVVKLNQVSPVMREAIVDIEDSRFYTHSGLDFKGLARAFFTNQESGAVTQGGSTLTQQYVKNVLVESATDQAELKAATATTVKRKLQEARYALYLEQHLSKDQVLEDYLNIAYFGDGAYGIQAAAKHYFNVPASALTLTQSAMLAGVVKNPNAFDPALHPKAGTTRRDTVLDRMHQLGHLTDAQWRAAKAAPLGLHHAPKSVDSCAISSQPFYCAYVRQSLLADPKFAPTRADRERLLFEGGLTIHTSLNEAAQQAAQNAANSVLHPGNSIATGVAMVQPGSGKVLAIAENRTYGPFSDGKDVQHTTDFTHTEEIIPIEQGTFSPGSTFKVFTLTAAIEQGLPLSTTFNAPPCYHSNLLANPPGSSCPGAPPADGYYHNAEDSEGGVFSLTTATWNSVNTYFIQLEQKVGVLNVAAMARKLGVSSPTIDPDYVNPYSGKPDAVSGGEGSLTLGDRTVSPLDMATAYATLAARGLRCDPRPIVAITDRVGTTDRPLSYSGPAKCRRVISAQTADTVTSVLEGVITNGTGSPNAVIGRPAAGKTGTAEDFKDAWFAGYIPQLSVAAAVGDPRGPETHTLGSEAGQGNAFGGVYPAMIWKATMQGAINALKLPVAPMPAPDSTQPQMPKGNLPDVTGQQLSDAQPLLEYLGFKVKVKKVANGAAAGTILKMKPGASDQVPLGTEVTLLVSTGSKNPISTLLPGQGGSTPGGPGDTGLGAIGLPGGGIPGH